MIYFLVIATICWENSFLCQWVKGYSLLSNLTGLVYLVSCWNLNPCGAVLCMVIRQIDLYGFCTLSHLIWHVQFVEYSGFFSSVFFWLLYKIKVLYVDMCPSLSFYFIVQCVCLGVNIMLSYHTALFVIQLEFENSKISSGSFSYPNFLYIFPYEDEFVLSRFVKFMLGNLTGIALDL